MRNTKELLKWSVSSRIFHWISADLLLVTWSMILLYGNLIIVFIGITQSVWHQLTVLDDSACD